MADPNLPPNVREFHCIHCNGKIRIPANLPSTTGPCPHCQGTITSPEPVAAVPSIPQYIPAPAPAPGPAPLPNVPAQVPVQQPQPVPQQQPAQPVVEAAPAARQETVIPQPRATQQPAPAAQEAPAELPPQRIGKSKSAEPGEPKKGIVPVIILTLLLLAFAAAAGFVVFKEMSNRQRPAVLTPPGASGQPPSQEAKERAESHYIRVGWQKEAIGVLNKFIAAKTVEEKLPHIINPSQLKPQMEAFYGGSVINDLDTPAEAFSIYQLGEQDRKRGIFLLTFERPPQFEMKEFFRPLASLEVQYGIEDADILLTSLANVENFASEPVRVNAFFKKTPDGLKLDWETFAQTKYRTFETMIEFPEEGQNGVFRVVIEEDVPAKGVETPGFKTYRVSDPSSPRTSARVSVKIDSDLGRTLSQINWIGVQNRPINRTATIELRWAGSDQPALEINRILCWEFLHLGGEIGNTAATAK